MDEGRTIRAIVFDFDGTLVCSNEAKRQSFFDVAAAHNIAPAIVENVLADTHGDRHGICQEIARRTGASTSADDLAARYTRLCHDAIAQSAWVPGAPETLFRLARRFALFINSATPTAALAALVRARGLENIFRGIYGRPPSKHDNLIRIALRHGWTPTELLLVGDSEDDRVAARNFGCTFLGVALNGTTARFDEIPPWLTPDLGRVETFVDALVPTARQGTDHV